MTTASRPFFLSPPSGFSESPLLTPRGALYTANAEQQVVLERNFDDINKLIAATPDLVTSSGNSGHVVHKKPRSLKWLSQKQVLELTPVMRPDQAVAGIYEPDAMDMDVHAIHQGFLRGFKSNPDSSLLVNAETQSFEWNSSDRRWTIRYSNPSSREVLTEITASVIINASGAWADEVAEHAAESFRKQDPTIGTRRVGLVPKRRTIIVFDPPAGSADSTGRISWPFTMDADEQWYIKPEAGRLWASPADATPTEPCDAQPDELDVAICVDRIQTATQLNIERLSSKWSGLRTFAEDGTPVVGFDPVLPNFCWLAGQGGYGIQTAPALGELSSLVALAGPSSRAQLPQQMLDLGVDLDKFSPKRFSS